eukprot:scaffold41905_cov168-Amphora_coffeaeformis.AAC.1
MACAYLLLAIHFLLVAPMTYASSSSIEEVAKLFVQEQGVPGLAVAAVAQTNDGLKIWSAGYGHADIVQGAPMTPDTSIWLGSVTKAMTGTAIIKAVEQGYLGLESLVDEILQDAGAFTLGDNETATRFASMTLEHLVTHRSDIRDHEDVYQCAYFVGDRNGDKEMLMDLFGLDNICVEDSPVSLGGYLEAYLSSGGAYYDPAQNFGGRAPGEEESYSNIASGLAGYLLSLAVNTTLPDYAAREIYELLGMENTSFRAADLSRIATPYIRLEEGEPYTALPLYDLATFPDGGLRSSANDMAKFLGCIMNEGTLDHTSTAVTTFDVHSGNDVDEKIVLLQPESVEDLLRPRFGGGTGVFWTWAELGGRLVVGHDGSDPGAASLMFFDPETKTGFVVLTNGDDSSFDFEAFLSVGLAALARAD